MPAASLLSPIVRDSLDQGSQTRGPHAPATRRDAARRQPATSPGSHVSSTRNGLRHRDLISPIHFRSEIGPLLSTFSHRFYIPYLCSFALCFALCFASQFFVMYNNSATRLQA